MRRFLERKFVMMLVGVILNVMQTHIGIPAETIAWLNTLIVGWIGSEAAVDAVKTYKNPPTGPNPDDVAMGVVELPKKKRSHS